MMQEKEALIEQQFIADYKKLYRLAYSYVHNENDALDIVQATGSICRHLDLSNCH